MLRWLASLEDRISASLAWRVVVMIAFAAIVIGAILCPIPDYMGSQP
jgi:hypothetical protein